MLSDLFIFFDKLLELLAQHPLLLFQIHDLSIELLKSLLKVDLVFENCRLVLFLNCKLHLLDLKCLRQLRAFKLDVLSLFLELTSLVLDLVKVSS